MNKSFTQKILFACTVSLALLHTPKSTAYNVENLFTFGKTHATVFAGINLLTTLRAQRLPIQILALGGTIYFGIIASGNQKIVITFLNDLLSSQGAQSQSSISTFFNKLSTLTR